MDLIIGAPTLNRGWVLDDWFRHLANQQMPEGLSPFDVQIVLNDGGSTDDTEEIIEWWAEEVPWDILVIRSPDVENQSTERSWNHSLGRYETMAHLRNTILTHVRAKKPDFYWSHDTDILAPNGALKELVRAQERFNGASPLVHLAKHNAITPNAARLKGHGMVRHHVNDGADDFVRTDVSFASVLMDPDLYAVDYEAHRHGEDIGWGFNARAAGMTFGINPSVVCKHIMLPEQLHAVDPRVGF